AKSLAGIPWRLAFALRDQGWWIRSDIIWNKTNAKPESVKDRPSRCYEHLFLLTKQQDYFYNYKALLEYGESKDLRRKRDVWNIAYKPNSEAHFAVFPPELPGQCIKAGTSEKGCCPQCYS